MASIEHRQWTRDKFLVSTDPDLIPISSVNAAFASDDVYWAKPMPEEAMRATLRNSMCFGLYEVVQPHALSTEPSSSEPSPPVVDKALVQSPHLDGIIDKSNKASLQFVGLARCITDSTTFVYLTDVYIYPSHQGQGLGKWLVGCIQEVIESMPYLRRSVLFTGDWERSVPFYEKTMDMTVVESKRPGKGSSGEGLALMMRKGKGHNDYTS